MIPLDHDEPTGQRVLPFPAGPFAKPAFSWRTWAAGQVATWRERRARNSGDLRGGALNGQNDYTGSAKSTTCNGFGMGPSGDRQNEPEDETECDTAPLSNGLRIAANGIQCDSRVLTVPLTPFKPDCATDSVRERAVDSALMDEIRQARSLLVDESEVIR